MEENETAKILRTNLLGPKIGQDLGAEREILSRSRGLWKTDLPEKGRLDLIAVLGKILRVGGRTSAQEALDLLVSWGKDGSLSESNPIFEGISDQLIRIFCEKDSHPVLISQIAVEMIDLAHSSCN